MTETTPTTVTEWAACLDEEIGTDYDAWSEAFTIGSAAGVGILVEHPDYRDEGRQFAAECGWFATLHDDGMWRVANGYPPVTDEQIEALRQEAGLAGDTEQVTICDAAVTGDAYARLVCQKVIAEAATRAAE
jgi:hypothetical protein